jgi:hypothetical protein
VQKIHLKNHQNGDAVYQGKEEKNSSGGEFTAVRSNNR